MQDDRDDSDPVASGAASRPRRMFSGSQALTDREHDVLEAIIAGETSKMAARRFGLSPRRFVAYCFERPEIGLLPLFPDDIF